MMGNLWNHLVSNWLENSKTMQTLVSLDSWAVIVGERNPSLHIDHGHQGCWNEFFRASPSENSSNEYLRNSLLIGNLMGMRKEYPNFVLLCLEVKKSFFWVKNLHFKTSFSRMIFKNSFCRVSLLWTKRKKNVVKTIFLLKS